MHEADGAADTTGGGKLRKVLKMLLHHFDCIPMSEELVLFLKSVLLLQGSFRCFEMGCLGNFLVFLPIEQYA